MKGFTKAVDGHAWLLTHLRLRPQDLEAVYCSIWGSWLNVIQIQLGFHQLEISTQLAGDLSICSGYNLKGASDF